MYIINGIRGESFRFVKFERLTFWCLMEFKVPCSLSSKQTLSIIVEPSNYLDTRIDPSEFRQILHETSAVFTRV